MSFLGPEDFSNIFGMEKKILLTFKKYYGAGIQDGRQKLCPQICIFLKTLFCLDFLLVLRNFYK
jgi:hypothetical protein